jgi:uncharacterized protein YbbK (DUF523 family)
MKQIAIGVSSCLLGHRVRYDGRDKRNSIVENELCSRFQCIPLCPEYAIGLGVPRAPVQLIQDGENFAVVGVADCSMDITTSLRGYADFVGNTLIDLCGYIFKSRSPTCGLTDTPVFDHHGKEVGKGRGEYAARLIRHCADLPAIDEIQLADPNLRQEFILQVETYSMSLKR